MSSSSSPVSTSMLQPVARSARGRLGALCTHPVFGFFLLLLVVLPGYVVRASYETSLWIDEVFSLKMAHMSVDQILDCTMVDAHPPGYYVALRLWLLAPTYLGHTPGLLWARLFSVVGLGALLLVAWVGLRRPLGPSGAAWASWVIALSGFVTFQGHHLRNYAWVMAGLLACQLVVVALLLDGHAPWRWRRHGPLLALYTLCAALSMYMHLLAGLALLLLGGVWGAYGWLGRRQYALASPRVAGLAVAQAAAVGAFLPWAVRLPAQFRHLATADTSWMTPPNGANLLSALFHWMVWGQEPPAEAGVRIALLMAGGVLFLGPLLAWVWARRQRRTAASATAPSVLFTTSFVVGVGFVVLTWLLTVAGVAKVFHASRYPVLVAPTVLVALVAAAGAARRPWLWLGPWCVAGVVGTVWGHWVERQGGLPEVMRRADPAFLPAPGESLYMISPELAPYMATTLRPYRVRPIDDIVRLPDAAGAFSVLVPDGWEAIWPWRDRVALALLRHSNALQLVGGARIGGDMRLLRVAVQNRAAWDSQTSVGLDLPLLPVPRYLSAVPGDPDTRQAVAVARPQDQRLADGWSFPEIGADLAPYRWTNHSPATVRFTIPGAPLGRALMIPPGHFRLRLRGYRQPYPTPTISVGAGLPGDVPHRDVEPGHFDIVLPLHITRPTPSDALQLSAPVWIPSRFLPTTESRPFGFQFFGAWLLPAPDK